MNIMAIKRLVETTTPDDLLLAESNLRNGRLPAIFIEGEEAGDQLTHVLAAQIIQEEIITKGVDITTAIRNFSKRVRNSIA